MCQRYVDASIAKYFIYVAIIFYILFKRFNDRKLIYF